MATAAALDSEGKAAGFGGGLSSGVFISLSLTSAFAHVQGHCFRQVMHRFASFRREPRRFGPHQLSSAQSAEATPRTVGPFAVDFSALGAATAADTACKSTFFDSLRCGSAFAARGCLAADRVSAASSAVVATPLLRREIVHASKASRRAAIKAKRRHIRRPRCDGMPLSSPRRVHRQTTRVLSLPALSHLILYTHFTAFFCHPTSYSQEPKGPLL